MSLEDGSSNYPDPEQDEPIPHILEDSIDLHTFRPRDIPDVVKEYLSLCLGKGWREVRLIHGKGTGFQRKRVQEVLKKLDFVETFHDAPPGRGHWGATIVTLRVSPTNSE